MTTVRAVQSLGNGDSSVRLRAALQIGTTPDPRFVDVLVERCAIEPDFSVREMLIPTLVDMIVEGANDTDAADALSALASDPASADRIAHRLVDRLAEGATASSARGRLTQALADIPGAVTERALADLAHDDDRAVALTATYIRRLRDAR